MYDSNLSGKSHIGKIKKTCISRLNIIRILAHKSWGLKYDTLVQIYKSLIRSIIEYSGLNYDSLGTNQKRELETIQNNDLRAIFKKNREFGNKNLRKLAKVDSIKVRMSKLNGQYLEKCVKQDNPLIIDLIIQYKNTIVSDREKGILNGRTILSQNKYFGVIMGKTD